MNSGSSRVLCCLSEHGAFTRFSRFNGFSEFVFALCPNASPQHGDFAHDSNCGASGGRLAYPFWVRPVICVTGILFGYRLPSSDVSTYGEAPQLMASDSRGVRGCVPARELCYNSALQLDPSSTRSSPPSITWRMRLEVYTCYRYI